MIRSFADAITATRPFLPRALVSPRAVDRLESFAADLPPPTASFGFECRLDDRSDIDLGVVVLRDPRAARSSFELSRGLAQSDRWRRIARFSKAWAQPRAELARFVPFIFLEYDGRQVKRGAPTPSLFASVQWPLGHARRGRAIVCVDHIAALLLDGELGGSERKTLKRCLAALPRGAAVLHVGVMLGRPRPSARLELAIPSMSVTPYLTTLGLGRRSHDVETVIRSFGNGCALMQIALDLEASFARGPIGVTVCETRRRQWSDLLGALVSAGLCSPAKRRAVLAWPGRTLRREISHLKISVGGHKRTAAKVYLTAALNPGA